MSKREEKAIEAKNMIAGEVKGYFKEDRPMNLKRIVDCLIKIEAVIGAGNLPTVHQIINNKHLLG